MKLPRLRNEEKGKNKQNCEKGIALSIATFAPLFSTFLLKTTR